MGGSSFQWPRHTSLGERGAPPRRWSVLEEGVLGTIAPCGPGTPACGEGVSCPGVGRCSRRAYGGG